MIQSFVYAGSSSVISRGVAQEIRFAPNLSREPVSFDAELKSPLRFREAISALHDVVISDLRFEKRDKTAYEAWKKQEQERERLVRQQAMQDARARIAEKHQIAVESGFQREYDIARKKYWSLRDEYAKYLQKHDPDLLRQLMPSDPVITVARDAVLFECFSKDESAYGCLSVSRVEGFASTGHLKLGTTNIDFSPQLYEQFQTLRTYRPTRFSVDPEGFSVREAQSIAHREEKIDLPTSWLRGFMKLQAAMTMPTTPVRIPRETLYSVLAFLKRNKAKKSPRALRFELEQGQPIRLVLEPWEKAFECFGRTYDGPPTTPIRIWGTRRLLALGRLLPLMDEVEVHLLASGLPSFWVARLGEMNFTLGLSGWTTNDFSKGSALDLLAPPRAASPQLIEQIANALKKHRMMRLPDLQRELNEPDTPLVSAGLRHLAQTGQVIFDLASDVYRYRQIMAQPLGEKELGPEDPELSAARKLIAGEKVDLTDRQDGPNLTRAIIGKAEGTPVEILVDADDGIKRGKCLCGFYKQYGLRNGPCRHMIALRFRASAVALDSMHRSAWYNRLFEGRR